MFDLEFGVGKLFVGCVLLMVVMYGFEFGFLGMYFCCL